MHPRSTKSSLLRGALLFVLSLSLGLSTACGEEVHPFATGEVPEASMVEIPNARLPFPGILTAGQPSPEQLREIRERGFKTVINLRPQKELGDRDEAAEAAALGLRYRLIPIDGAQGVSQESAALLVEALEDPANYPVLVHCASSNRVGALFAIDAGIRRGQGLDEALQTGRSAGMQSLETRVRELLLAK